MQTQYSLAINNSALFKNEALEQLLTNLDKLDFISNNTLLTLNNSIIERKNKISNLHSRIIRVNEILSILETIPQALTLLSKRFYPEEVNSFVSKSIFFNEVSDTQFTSNSQNESKINSRIANKLSVLSIPPNETIEDLKLTQEITNGLKFYSSIKNKLFIKSNDLVDSSIHPSVEMLTSIFNFTSKVKEFGNKTESSVKVLASNTKVLKNQLKSKKSKNLTNAPITLGKDYSIVQNIKAEKALLTTKNIESIDSKVDLLIKKDLNVLSHVVDIDLFDQTNISLFDTREVDQQVDDIDEYDDKVYDDIYTESTIDRVKKIKTSIFKKDFNPLSKMASNETNLSSNKPSVDLTTSGSAVNLQKPQSENLSTVQTTIQLPNHNQINIQPVQNTHINSATKPSVVNPPIKTEVINNTSANTAVISNIGKNIPKPPPLIIPVPKIKPKVEAPNPEIKKEEEKKNEPPQPNSVSNIFYLLYRKINFLKP